MVDTYVMRYNTFMRIGRVTIKWSSEFAYAIGLIVTDGSLSKDGRHIDFTSKELPQINNFQTALGTNYTPSIKYRSLEREKKYYRIQIGDVKFYRFLESIGLMPNKTKIIGEIKIPNEFFPDFLRGHLDGDGTFHSYMDKRWKSSFMFYTSFNSASKNHIDWLQSMIKQLANIKGHITKAKKSSVYKLNFAKADSRILIPKIYYSPDVLCLERKRLKIFNNSDIVQPLS